jgi:hypothetical protein
LWQVIRPRQREAYEKRLGKFLARGYAGLSQALRFPYYRAFEKDRFWRNTAGCSRAQRLCADVQGPCVDLGGEEIQGYRFGYFDVC